MARKYDNTKRARQSARTAARILESAEGLIREKPLSEVTLNDIADGAEVTVQTVLRHHESRDGVLQAVAERLGDRVIEERSAVEAGNIKAAIDNVLKHYESEGDLVLRVLSEEATSSIAAETASRGRLFHRSWVERVFGPLLATEEPMTTLDALVVATDLYTWRLLRRDLGRSLEDTRKVMIHLVAKALED